MTNLGKVLLVDNDEVSNFITAHALEMANVTAQIAVAKDSHEALEKIAEGPFDLVLLEAKIACVGSFDFLDTLEQLREFTGMAAPVVVVITSWEDKIDKARAAQYPIRGYLAKPLTQEQVGRLFDLVATGAE